MTTEELYAAMPFAAVLGLRLETATHDLVTASLAWAPERCTAGGVVHGGVLMGLADACGGLCAALNLPEGATGTATLTSSTNLLRAVRRGRVVASAQPLHRGRSTIVVQTEIRDDELRLVAKTIQSQAVLV